MDIAKADGAEVSGSDLALDGHDARFAEGADTVVYSSAVPDTNPETEYARSHGKELLSRAEYLGKVAKRYRTVLAVAGSHGKTTCTAMLGGIFEPYDPTVHLGGEYGGKNGRVGGKKYFITEACEYKRNFLHLLPDISVVLNVELDHTDYYRDIDDITDAFAVFSRSGKIRVLCGDDKLSEPLKTGKYITFGLGRDNYLRADDIECVRGETSFTMVRAGAPLGAVRLKVMGRHNVYNALAAAAAAFSAGLDFADIKRGLENFRGVKRRLEYLGSAGNCDVFTDYAHHPHEIQSVISALRDAGYKRVAAVFEPHTYSRTLSLADDFVKALCSADGILLAEIFAAREEPLPGVSSGLLCRKLLDAGRSVRCFDTYFELNEHALRLAPDFDALIYCGAGTIDSAARILPKTTVE